MWGVEPGEEAGVEGQAGGGENVGGTQPAVAHDDGAGVWVRGGQRRRVGTSRGETMKFADAEVVVCGGLSVWSPRPTHIRQSGLSERSWYMCKPQWPSERGARMRKETGEESVARCQLFLSL